MRIYANIGLIYIIIGAILVTKFRTYTNIGVIYTTGSVACHNVKIYADIGRIYINISLTSTDAKIGIVYSNFGITSVKMLWTDAKIGVNWAQKFCKICPNEAMNDFLNHL